MNEIPGMDALLEKYGLPGLVIGLLAWLLVKFTGNRAAEAPEAQMTRALRELSEKLDDLKSEVTDRMARVETEVKNLKEKGH